ncbi:hypothetical protein FOA43_004557 [Brettanomyces nanus]|uniref:Uncharacterized protein n=1 Tax=Eeniella nana TaxID=13502 RepID=A0A875SBR3_EENNA|nr:uncharacterized protein FOA43_004557 [Brettanomyces nanus]QPG77152.1 hypothetical protein FOA43_004557 [Brettanomyces nanus]
MTTQIFSDTALSTSDIENLTNENESRELKWLISSIIKPQLPEIREGLSSCLRQVSEDNEEIFKLPLSSHKSEMLKGTVSRQNFKIVGLHVSIKAKNFNGGKSYDLTLKPGVDNFIIIRQLLDCHDYIYNAVHTIDKIADADKLDSMVFVKYIEQLYRHISSAKKALYLPNPAYIFPEYRNCASSFEPEMPEQISLDFFVNNSELTIDFQNLKRVARKPWCTIIDKAGRISFVDHVRDKISKDRARSIHQIIVDEYQKLLRWKKAIPADNDVNEEETTSTIGMALKSIFVSSGDPSLSTLLKSASKYLEQCITYMDNTNKPYVVNILDKCEMITSDPILLSLSIKLDSLERAVHRIAENLKNLTL